MSRDFCCDHVRISLSLKIILPCICMGRDVNSHQAGEQPLMYSEVGGGLGGVVKVLLGLERCSVLLFMTLQLKQ